MERFLFRLPDVGEGVAEAELIAWHIKPGDEVTEDQNLADIMTDKATLEIGSPVSGKVVAVHGEVGGMLPVGAVLVEFEVNAQGNANAFERGEIAPPTPPAVPLPTEAAQTVQASRAEVATIVPTAKAESRRASATRLTGSEPMAAPATRRRAYELGVPLQFVPGSGPGGRITPDDLAHYLASGSQEQSGDPRYLSRSGDSETRILGLRRKIAERMEEAKRRIPHINYVEAVDVTELEGLRQVLNDKRSSDRPKLSLLPFLVRALVRTLPDFPQINAHYDDDAGIVRAFGAVHVGIAVNTPAGLKVPVIRHAETRDVWSLATDLNRIGAAARDGSATRDELGGSTITLTSLGTLGGLVSTPVINRPEVAILAPNKIVDQPVFQGSVITIRKMMNLSSAFDHRIIDGYDAASFIQQLKVLIEHPALIFMD